MTIRKKIKVVFIKAFNYRKNSNNKFLKKRKVNMKTNINKILVYNSKQQNKKDIPLEKTSFCLVIFLNRYQILLCKKKQKNTKC